MIEHSSELLNKLIDIEKMKLEQFKMPHMPTLGKAYEGITKKGIDQNFAIPKHLDLKVVSGFISIAGEMLPQQIDGMLVCGDGVQYGPTDEYIYPIDQVLCIFEIKKTLTKSDYNDAFDHLRYIRQRNSEYFESKFEDPDFEPNIVLAQKHFAQITGRTPPEKYGGIHSLSKADAILFYTLVQESLAPVSIIHGYGGYTTESGMRNAFLKILEEKAKDNRQGLGVPSFPTLVTSNEYSIVKGNGMPFIAIDQNRDWAALVSTRCNVAKIILEVIWSKISFYFGVEMPWGKDLEQENVTPLLFAIPKEIGDMAGWVYRPLSLKESELKSRNVMKDWEPSVVGGEIVTAFSLLSAYGSLDTEALKYISSEHNVEIETLEGNLLDTMLFMKKDGLIKPINTTTMLLAGKDGSNYLSSDENRFNHWCDKNNFTKTYMTLHLV
ncbi:hypothetical protein BCT33_12565 [Vibrio lentus]|nr:hypothetical protein BCU14_14260 [Vibrio lentus]PMN34727.1 hypothetical protein BCT33_12565 [Vibrio lentus]PMN57238.1 hypothetical protein BCT29_10680 [Vibrio lentus]